jgi:hypothetical protein
VDRLKVSCEKDMFSKCSGLRENIYNKIYLFCLQVKAVKKPSYGFIRFPTVSQGFPPFFAGTDDEFPTVLGDFASAADAICRTPWVLFG